MSIRNQPIQTSYVLSLRKQLLRRWATVLVAAVGLASIAGQAFAGNAAAKSSKPNIVFILADDLGYSDAGCYGSEIDTPNLDALAGGGLRFTQFYNTARCWPTRSALLTGYYAQQIRSDVLPELGRGAKGTRPTWAPLLADLLKPAGYRSYTSGKWHIDGDPPENGFDHSYVIEDHNRFFNPQKHLEDGKLLPPIAAGTNFYLTTHIADHAIRCLKEHAVEHAAKPFFSYVAFTSPHFPLQAPKEVVEKYRERYRAGWQKVRAVRIAKQKELGLFVGHPSKPEVDVGPPYNFPEDIAKLGPGEVNHPLPWDSLTDEQRAFQADKMAVHAAMIDVMDQGIGRIVAQLKAMNALDDTLILFASDNGASAEIMIRGDGNDLAAYPGSAETFLCLGPGWSTVSNTPNRRHKTWVHEGGISTPLIAHWPKGIAARGEFRHDPTHVIDFVPTALELAGVTKPTTIAGRVVPPAPGRSLVPAFAADGGVKHDYLWWFHDGNRAVRLGDWKLVAAEGDPWELYDLSTDRAETKNLASAEPAKVRELEAEWNRRTQEFTELVLQEPGVTKAAPKAGKAKKKK